jgi:hypothetical protein
VFAVGRLRPRVPTLGLEKEIAQATGRKPTSTKSDDEALCAILTAPENDYLAREVCWVFSVQGVDAFIVKAADATTLKWVLSTVRPDKGPSDLDVVIGRMAGRASMVECNGLMLPTVGPAQVYSFDRASFARSIQRPKDIDEKSFDSAVKQTFDVIAQLNGNYGLTEAHRALNYLVIRDPHLYEVVARQLADGAPLTAIASRPSALSGGRRVIEVILHFKTRASDQTRSYFARVDVTDLFPFLVSPIAPYIAMN